MFLEIDDNRQVSRKVIGRCRKKQMSLIIHKLESEQVMLLTKEVEAIHQLEISIEFKKNQNQLRYSFASESTYPISPTIYCTYTSRDYFHI